MYGVCRLALLHGTRTAIDPRGFHMARGKVMQALPSAECSSEFTSTVEHPPSLSWRMDFKHV